MIGVENIGQWILDQMRVHSREVFAVAIAKRASTIVIAHNYPGGKPTPSEADIRVMRDLIRAGQLLRTRRLTKSLGQSTTERLKEDTSVREMAYFS